MPSRRNQIIGWIALLCAGAVRGDVLWVTTSNNSTIEMRPVQIIRLDGDQLIFNASGNQASRPVNQVARISLDNNPALSQAEEAFASGDFAAATDKYQALSSSSQGWIRDWTMRRLSESAAKAGKFAPAVTAYIALVQQSAKLASSSRPAIPTNEPAALDAARALLKEAIASTTANDARDALLDLLFDIEQARHDTVAAGDVAEQLLQIQKKPEYHLAVAARDFTRQQYASVIKTIEQNKASFTEPQQQADALYLLASAKYASAKSADDLKDAALDYMRIVTFFADAGATMHVTDARLKAVEILDKLNDKSAAEKLRSNSDRAT